MLTLPLGRISGRALSALVTAVRKTPARAPLTRLFRAQLGIDALRALSPDARAPLPFSHAPLSARADHERASLQLPLAVPETWPRSVASVGDRYRSGDANPVAVVTRALEHARNLAARSPTLGPLCGYDDERALAAAQDSARRLADGSARSALEGIPIAVKEEIDTAGFTTRMGSNCLRRNPAALDAVAVARLRA
ncbi:MAG TPA: amidase family protein, partial [Polyangiaceae bacterium]